MKNILMKWLVALVVLLAGLVVIDISVRVETQDNDPCLVIPTRFILDEPQCAQKLVRAANVTGVRVVSAKALKQVARGNREIGQQTST